MERNIDNQDDAVAKYPNDDVSVQKGHAPQGDVRIMLELLGGKKVEPLETPGVHLIKQIGREKE